VPDITETDDFDFFLTFSWQCELEISNPTSASLMR